MKYVPSSSTLTTKYDYCYFFKSVVTMLMKLQGDASRGLNLAHELVPVGLSSDERARTSIQTGIW